MNKSIRILGIKSRYIPILLAIMGGIVYLWLSWLTACQTPGVLDEGSYLYKGYLFASGEYQPFEDFGPNTGKMPLSFLPYGYSQLIFGLGLTTGRYTAIFFGFLTLIPLWLLTKRFSNEWWAAAVVWIVALNSTSLFNYSLAVSQPLVIFLMAWSLFFVLGRERTSLQILIGVFLGTLIVFTRINVGAISFLIVCYVFWEHGKKRGVQALLVWGGVLLIGHLLYWPDIMKIWAPWLPREYTPFLDQFRVVREGITGASWDPTNSMLTRLLSFFSAARSDIVAVIGWISVILLWPKNENWKTTEEKKRVSIFLLISFTLLLFMHLWASLGKDYCVYCFQNYLRFFDILGILLFVIMLPSLERQPSKVRNIIIVAFFTVTLVGISLSAFSEIGEFVLSIPVPRVKEGSLQPGLVTVWSILSNKFNLDLQEAKQVASSLLGLGCALLFLIIGYFAHKRYVIRNGNVKPSFAFYLIVSLVLIGTPVSLISNVRLKNQEVNVLEAHETVGDYLQEYIPAGSTVYWAGGNDATPLLYIPEAIPYLPQLNGGYSFIFGGDPVELLKFGLWNEALREQWKNEADYFVIEQSRYNNWKQFFVPSEFDEFPRAPVSLSYDEGSVLRVFRRKP